MQWAWKRWWQRERAIHEDPDSRQMEHRSEARGAHGTSMASGIGSAGGAGSSGTSERSLARITGRRRASGIGSMCGAGASGASERNLARISGTLLSLTITRTGSSSPGTIITTKTTNADGWSMLRVSNSGEGCYIVHGSGRSFFSALCSVLIF